MKALFNAETHPIISVQQNSCIKIQKQPPKVLYKKMFYKISQNSQENTCARVSFLIKLQTESCNFNKKETHVNFAKFLRISFLQNTSWRLLMKIIGDFEKLQILAERNVRRWSGK